MKSIIALVLLVVCAAQVQSSCVNRNSLYHNYGLVHGYGGLGYLHNYGLHGYGLYPRGVHTYGVNYPHGCNCGKCEACQSVTYPFNSYPSPVVGLH